MCRWRSCRKRHRFLRGGKTQQCGPPPSACLVLLVRVEVAKHKSQEASGGGAGKAGRADVAAKTVLCVSSSSTLDA